MEKEIIKTRYSQKVFLLIVLSLVFTLLISGCQLAKEPEQYVSNRPKTEDGADLILLERRKASFADNQIDEVEVEEIEEDEEELPQETEEPTTEPAETEPPVEETTESRFPINDVTVSSHMNARAGPSMDAIINYVIPPETFFSIIGEEGEWYQVEYEGQSAYIEIATYEALRVVD
ncbi:MAG: hypothetical protein GX326_02815 [Clostridiaceae bacterium]|nr:hypothetical protein [Clostridiaceae bacterium]